MQSRNLIRILWISVLDRRLLFRELRRMQSPIFREILPGSPAEPTGWKIVWYILQFRIVRDGMLRLMENLQRSLIPEV